MSSLLQDRYAYVGQLNVFEKGAEIIEQFLGLPTSSMQLNNIVQFYGEACAADEYLLNPVLENIKAEEKVYIGMDGSMAFTREEGWKEVKLSRIFKESDCICPEGKSGSIRRSQYLAQLTNSQCFTKQMDTLIDKYNLKQRQLVFMGDGAPWIKNYIEDSFSEATSILDFYHAKEHLYQFTETAFTDKILAKKWAEEQSELLLESKVENVIENIEKKGVEQQCKKQAGTLINYYQANIKRMDYKYYKTIGAGIIGSGAIESAHRTVIQNRCKQSGQVWSMKGLQQMLNLKVIYQNKDWNRIVQLTQKKAA